MTIASETGAHGPAAFETVLPEAPQAIVSFEEERPSALRRAQHFLHAFPTTVPFLVLLIGNFYL